MSYLTLFHEMEANYIYARIGHRCRLKFLKTVNQKLCMYTPYLTGSIQKSPALAQRKPNLSIYIPFLQNFINHLILF